MLQQKEKKADSKKADSIGFIAIGSISKSQFAEVCLFVPFLKCPLNHDEANSVWWMAKCLKL